MFFLPASKKRETNPEQINYEKVESSLALVFFLFFYYYRCYCLALFFFNIGLLTLRQNYSYYRETLGWRSSNNDDNGRISNYALPFCRRSPGFSCLPLLFYVFLHFNVMFIAEKGINNFLLVLFCAVLLYRYRWRCREFFFFLGTKKYKGD